MRLVTVFLTLLLGHASRADVIAELPREIVERSLNNLLTKEDVPPEWRQRVVRESDEGRTRRIYYRGDKKLLEVEWSQDSKEGDFMARVFDGDETIVRFHHFRGSTAIGERSEDGGYKLLVVVSDDGKVSFGIKHDNGFDETFKIDGRESSLMDDIDYMRGRIAEAEFLPLIRKDREKAENDRKSKKAEQDAEPKSDRAGG